MLELTLHRNRVYSDRIIGKLIIDGDLLAYTLERPWLDNKRSISCIPEGTYTCVWQRSPKFGWTYQVLDVPNRSRILIHSGNVVKNTYGCILLGTRRGVLWSEPAVLSSRRAMRMFHGIMEQAPFTLEIRGN